MDHRYGGWGFDTPKITATQPPTDRIYKRMKEGDWKRENREWEVDHGYGGWTEGKAQIRKTQKAEVFGEGGKFC